MTEVQTRGSDPGNRLNLGAQVEGTPDPGGVLEILISSFKESQFLLERRFNKLFCA